jgi:hypothetical protein
VDLVRFELTTSSTPFKKYQSVTGILTRNKRLRRRQFGRRWTPRGLLFGVWTPRGLRDSTPRNGTRHACTRARGCRGFRLLSAGVSRSLPMDSLSMKAEFVAGMQSTQAGDKPLWPRSSHSSGLFQAPICGAEHALHYLGRYTHRIAISNHRLVSLAEGRITFRWRDSAHKNKKGSCRWRWKNSCGGFAGPSYETESGASQNPRRAIRRPGGQDRRDRAGSRRRGLRG